MRELKPDYKAQLTLESGRCNDELNIRASTCHRVTKCTAEVLTKERHEVVVRLIVFFPKDSVKKNRSVYATLVINQKKQCKTLKLYLN